MTITVDEFRKLLDASMPGDQELTLSLTYLKNTPQTCLSIWQPNFSLICEDGQWRLNFQ